MSFKLRVETLEKREVPAGFEPVDPITGLPDRPPEPQNGPSKYEPIPVYPEPPR